MKSTDIQTILTHSARLLDQDEIMVDISPSSQREYANDELSDFTFDLSKYANEANILLLERSSNLNELQESLELLTTPVLVFQQVDGLIMPAFLCLNDKEMVLRTMSGEEEVYDPEKHALYKEVGGNKVIYLTIFPYKDIVSENEGEDGHHKEMSPVKRLFHLLRSEKRDIIILLIYALFIGGIGLTLPLGIQATVELVSGGVVVSSVYILITLVILGVVVAGILQVMQITIVEFIQRRIFSRAALEFAIKIPKIKVSALSTYHAPELINRFFDVLTLQKGLPKLLIDMTSAVMQIFFGLLLLSFYHPFFVFFGLALISVLAIIFMITGPTGLRTSIKESKYKYQVVYWLEELARTLNSFKISGNSFLPVRKTEKNVNNYLTSRRAHFRVLVTQYAYVLLFKAAVTGGLLIIGTILVIQKEITLGQFVASEVIIILIINSVEKIILYMEVVYDMLTAVDKIAGVTDLPIEKQGGINIAKNHTQEGFNLHVRDLRFKYHGDSKYAISHIDLDILPGERICISGPGGSGKSTLAETISGFNTDFEGILTYDGISFRDLDINYLRDKIGKNVSQNDIFDGTILENILVGKPSLHVENALEAIRRVGLQDKVNSLADGLNTHILSGGKGFSNSFVNRLILARCLAKQPRLLILNEFFQNFSRREKLDIYNLIENSYPDTTLLIVSNDPVLMTSVDRVVWMENGSVIHSSRYEELVKNIEIKETIEG